MRTRADSESVSPTAHATGYFWHRHGLSHPGLLMPEGRRIDLGFRLLIASLKAVGVHFDALMLARHVGIDTVLARHIESGKVTRVIELAAGFSPRGWRFCKRFPQLTYIETDLPHMAAMKRRLLDDAGLGSKNHRVEAVNVLLDEGPESLAQLAGALDPAGGGLAVITEGLISYLDPDAAAGMWARIARALKRFPAGVYLSDSYVKADRYGLAGSYFRGIVQRVVGGRMYLHFDTLRHAGQVLKGAGFARATLHAPDSLPQTRKYSVRRGGNRVRILEAVV